MTKSSLRQIFKDKRQALSPQRRDEASQMARETLLNRFPAPTLIASFASFADELDLWPLNAQLALEGRFLLPRIEGHSLRFYAVSDIRQQLQASSCGILEPIPHLCQEANVQDVSVVLVPGIAFDSTHCRLGYGKGFYDRLLRQFPHLYSCGLAFHEQLSTSPLPQEPHDVALSHLFSF